MWPEKLSVSTVVMVVGTLNTFAALASATTLFFSICRSIDCTPNAICGCWSMKSTWLLSGVRRSRKWSPRHWVSPFALLA